MDESTRKQRNACGELVHLSDPLFPLLCQSFRWHTSPYIFFMYLTLNWPVQLWSCVKMEIKKKNDKIPMEVGSRVGQACQE